MKPVALGIIFGCLRIIAQPAVTITPNSPPPATVCYYPPPTGTVCSPANYTVTYTVSGGSGTGYTWCPGTCSCGTVPGLGATMPAANQYKLSGTATGCPNYPFNQLSCPSPTEPMYSVQIGATDSLGNCGTVTFPGVIWTPNEQAFIGMDAAAYQNLNVLASSVSPLPQPPVTGGHLTFANPVFVSMATNPAAAWESMVDAIAAAGGREVSIEVDLGCIYNTLIALTACSEDMPPGQEFTSYTTVIQYIRSKRVNGQPMFISWNPEARGDTTAFGAACSSILGGHTINYMGGSGSGTYAPGVSDFYNCLTMPMKAGQPSLYQWIMLNWVQEGDIFVTMHEPTTMTGRWGGPCDGQSLLSCGFSGNGRPNQEGAGGSGGGNVCGNGPPAGGNTCSADWINNFYYGGSGSNNIITYLMSCASGSAAACSGLNITICGYLGAGPPCLTLAATTDYLENQGAGTNACHDGSSWPTGTKCWAASLAYNLPTWVAMGLDIYTFSPTTFADLDAAFRSAIYYGHPVFVEELGAAQTWVQSGFPQGLPTDAIKGYMNCDWQSPKSQHYTGMFGPMLSYLASVNATSVSIFPAETLAACSPTYPDTSVPVSNNNTAIAAGNLELRLYSPAFYGLAAVQSAWSKSVESGQSVQH